MVRIGKKGRILEGEPRGWYILVQDDRAETGGYYVFTSSVPGFDGGVGEGYDDWVENEETLAALFEARGWTVEWES